MAPPARSPAAPARPAPRTAAGREPPASAGPGGGAALLAVLTATLCVVGLVMVLSASSVQALREQGSSWMFFRRQLLWVALGATATLLAARVDYHRWRRLGLAVLVASVAMLVAVLVPGVGISVGGSARWLGAGGWRVQPSELAKLGLLLFSADLLARLQRGPSLRPAMWGTLGAFGLVAALVMLQPDMGTTLILGAIAMSVLFAAGVPLRSMAGLGLLTAVAALVVGVLEPYRRARLLSFRNPWADASNTGYQVVQSLVGLGTGRLTGVGVGASRAKWGFLPNAHTDFIFAIIGEELGLVGSLLVISLFLAVAAVGVRTALRAPDLFGALLAAGITGWVASQAVINIGAVTGMLPVTGVPLPFVSFGGSSLVILMGAMGIMINVAVQGRAPGRS